MLSPKADRTKRVIGFFNEPMPNDDSDGSDNEVVDIFAEDEWDEYVYETPDVTQRYLGSWRNLDEGWPGTTYICKFILANEGRSTVAGKRVLELGAGNALPSLLAAHEYVGAAEVVITDGDPTEVAMVKRSIERFVPRKEAVSTERLRWGTPGAEKGKLAHRKEAFEVMMACECCYELACVPLLVESIVYFLAPHGTAFILNTCAQTHGSKENGN